ncbi:MAG: hypothetical protein HRU15_10360 [Planctomycetes bacterium]|nr:hypothetical protein [Planctomycetota bacterium]
MVEAIEMGPETARIDNVLDHLAQGEVYAEQGTMAIFADDIREVPDAASAYDPDPSNQRQAVGSVTGRFRRERYRGAMYVPKMDTADKIIALTVLGLLASFGILAALAAFNMIGLTENIRVSYTTQGPQLEIQPVPLHVLLNQDLFEEQLSRYPDQVVSLYMKRAYAFRTKKKWPQAVRSFEEAALHSDQRIAMDDHFNYIDSLVHAGLIKRAMTHLESRDRDKMTEDERKNATALLGRLHFALQP